MAGRYACRVCFPGGASLGSMTEGMEMSTTFCTMMQRNFWCGSLQNCHIHTAIYNNPNRHMQNVQHCLHKL